LQQGRRAMADREKHAIGDNERPPPPAPRTKWTRRVPHPVLIGHAASLTKTNEMQGWEDMAAGAEGRGRGSARVRKTYGVRDAACPISTGCGTRRVRLVRREGGGEDAQGSEEACDARAAVRDPALVVLPAH